MASTTDSSLLDAIELQQQLDEKDQLVSALTERLEEAAEQLDRVHRSGGDRGGRGGGGGGLSSEAAAQQQTLIEQVTKSVEIWEDIEPREAFERIEMRLDDLREMLSGAVVEKTGDGAASPPKADPLSGWEKMKAQLMEGDSTATPSPSGSTSASEPSGILSADSASATPQPESADTAPEPIQPLSELALPEPVDFDEAEREELEEAIEVRDQFIKHLAGRLRSAESNAHEDIDWETLNNAPEELRESLQQLESELHDRLRIAEVDLSLERARLSRIETKIRGMQKQIEKRLESAGHQVPSQDNRRTQTEDETPKPKKDTQSKSWFGKLGR